MEQEKKVEAKELVKKTNIDTVIGAGPAAVEEYLINVSVAEFKRDVYQLKNAYANKQLAHDVILAMSFAISDSSYDKDFETHLDEKENKELEEADKLNEALEKEEETPTKEATKKKEAPKKSAPKKSKAN